MLRSWMDLIADRREEQHQALIEHAELDEMLWAASDAQDQSWAREHGEALPPLAVAYNHPPLKLCR